MTISDRPAPESEVQFHSPRSPIFSSCWTPIIHPVLDLHSISDHRYRILPSFRSIPITESQEDSAVCIANAHGEMQLAPIVMNGKQPDKTLKQQTALLTE